VPEHDGEEAQDAGCGSGTAPATSLGTGHDVTARPVSPTVGTVTLDGDLALPADPVGLVVFAHGSGSSRHSPRNRYVAAVLQRAGLAALLLDLLTFEEEQVDLRTRQLRFDVDLLAERLAGTLAWCREQPDLAPLPLGLFGASTGGGAALLTAARSPELVYAVVSRGGRPDLAGSALAEVRAPVLLVVGGADPTVLELNRSAAADLASSELLVVPGATHLFEEPGALEQVADASADFLRRHLEGLP
jgi:putative phosphoribosyl transferase